MKKAFSIAPEVFEGLVSLTNDIRNLDWAVIPLPLTFCIFHRGFRSFRALVLLQNSVLMAGQERSLNSPT